MDPSLRKLPAALEERTRRLTLAGVPALVSHPDWDSPAPTLIWMHGRTAFKELDSGRYLRCVRAGIATVALDLPMHGERAEPGGDEPANTLRVLKQMVAEIDGVVDALAVSPETRGRFDANRLAIGGMSAGGMATLRRLCDPHPFVCAHVEATCGDLRALYASPAAPVHHADSDVAPLDPAQHLDGWRPIPLQALHTTGDEVVPIDIQRSFLDRLRARYRAQGADPAMISLVEYEQTGAPREHAGFGRYGHPSKESMVAFLRTYLVPETTPRPENPSA